MSELSGHNNNPASTALSALRSATASRHHATEALLGLGGPLDRARYGRILQGFEAFLASWEPRIAQALPAELRPWFARRSRLALVRRDLEALGLSRLAQPQETGGAHDAASVFGALYVMEGSALGGRVISRRLAEHMGLDADTGAAYFNGPGADTGAQWREFLQLLADRVAPADEQRACRGAERTFDALGGLFRKILNEPAAA
jgi:heme oxygenase (biliverdin-IX-beta and delta-forming)